MFCSNCGTQLSDDAQFCSNCGKPTSSTVGASGSSTENELEQEQTNQTATDESIEVEPGSLESAVREAQAGAMFRLKAGEHRLSDPLEIDKPLSLIGEGMNNTRVLCDGEAHVVRFVGDGQVGLWDLSFEHLGSRGAHVVEVSGGGISIRRCRFTGGVYEEGGGGGLILSNDTRGVVANCEAVQNESSGIVVSDWAEPTLEANTCQGNGLAGIIVIEQAQPNLEANNCEGNKSGIAYLGSGAGAARHNTCRANADHGIVLWEHTKPELESNTCSDNGSGPDEPAYGIGVFDQAYPTLEANTCQGNTGLGIGYHDSASGTARHNVCSANVSGIGVTDQAHPTLEANTCQENVSYGIHYAYNAAGVARHNVCRLNREDDLYLEPSAHPMLEENSTGSPEPQPAQTGSQTERTLYEVPCHGGIFFDAGARRNYGEGTLTITNRRLILQSAIGGTQQILLRDIGAVSREDHWGNRHVSLSLSNPYQAFQLSCKGRGSVDELASIIDEALANSVS